jgi:hypothetical protein
MIIYPSSSYCGKIFSLERGFPKYIQSKVKIAFSILVQVSLLGDYALSLNASLGLKVPVEGVGVGKGETRSLKLLY